MNTRRLIFVGLYNDTNLGDPIIAYSTEWLISQYVELSNKSIRLDLFPKCSMFNRLKKIVNKIVDYNMYLSDYEHSLYKYYKCNINENDLVVVVGGGLIKYKYQYFYLALINLLKASMDKKANVVFNSLGIEGFDEKSLKCQRLKQTMIAAMDNKCLIYISTRDDIKTLHEKYLNSSPQIPCLKVADPAVWCADAFNISRKVNSDIIGVGIIRGGIFYSNGIDYSSDKLQKLYIDIVKRLIENNNKVVLFTNGTTDDNLFAKAIYKKLVKEEGVECELDLPKSAFDLIYNISKFKGIIAGRLHSCIIAYSLNVPAIGLVWNDKLTMFGENIGLLDNFITYDNFSSSYIVDRLKIAINEGYNHDIYKKFKQTIKDSIKEICNLYIVK